MPPFDSVTPHWEWQEDSNATQKHKNGFLHSSELTNKPIHITVYMSVYTFWYPFFSHKIDQTKKITYKDRTSHRLKSVVPRLPNRWTLAAFVHCSLDLEGRSGHAPHEAGRKAAPVASGRRPDDSLRVQKPFGCFDRKGYHSVTLSPLDFTAKQNLLGLSPLLNPLFNQSNKEATPLPQPSHQALHPQPPPCDFPQPRLRRPLRRPPRDAAAPQPPWRRLRPPDGVHWEAKPSTRFREGFCSHYMWFCICWFCWFW